MGKVKKLIIKEHPSRPLPEKIARPCDYKLQSAISALEIQVGTVEGYNRLCDAAVRVKEKIDRGEGKPGLECFAVNPYPAIFSKKNGKQSLKGEGMIKWIKKFFGGWFENKGVPNIPRVIPPPRRRAPIQEVWKSSLAERIKDEK